MLEEAANTTNVILHRLTHGWKSPRVTVVRIEVLVVIAAFLSLFLLFFGSSRRWCKHWSIQYGVLGGYIMSFSLVTYTMGSIQSSASRNEMFPVWALSLLAVLGGTNSITASKLSDNKEYNTQLIQQSLMAGYALLIISNTTDSTASLAMLLLLLDIQQKNGMRIMACFFACKSWNPSKEVADYMELVDKPIKSAYDPVNMSGYPYLVSWYKQSIELKAPYYKSKMVDKDDVVTIEKIWQCNHGLLASTGGAGAKLKDVCLSFSLYELLKRRYFGFHCHESGQKKTRDFIFRGLLLEKEKGYHRAFRTIEVELGFLYDFFYTKYVAIHFFANGFFIWGLFSIFCICFVGASLAMQKFKTGSRSDGIIIVDTNAADIVITLAVLTCLILLQVLQVILYWASNWGKVALVCDYVYRPSLEGFASYIRKIQEFFSGFSLFEKYYWQHRLGQFSLLESYANNTSISGKAASRMRTWFKRKAIRSPFDSSLKGSRPHGCVEGDPAELSVQVRTAVIDTLLRTYVPTDGDLTSLMSTKLPGNMSWTFKEGDTHIHTILVWHIATCYCEIATTSFCANEDREDMKKHRDVATKLCKYCAYLVVFAPKLLPGHHWNTSAMFNAVVKEARCFLKGAEDKYETMKTLEGSTDTIFQRGTLLGRQLETEYNNVSQHWKVMADFWTEMIIYVAPAGDVEAHIEYLTKGGEFITHLWVLLFHAGIVKLGETSKGEEEENKKDEEKDEEGSIDVVCA